MAAACLIAIVSAVLGQTSDLTHVATYTDVQYPARVAVAADGSVFVTDPPNNEVVKYDAAGAVVATLAVPQGPVGVAVHPWSGLVLVSRLDGVVQTFTPALAPSGTLNPAPFTMTTPNDIAIHSVTGEMFVTDSAQNRVLVFSPADGSLVRTWGATGSGMNQFQSPQAIAIDEALGNVIVSDVDNFRVQVFNTAGVFQYKFGYKTLYVGSTEVAWFARSEGIAIDSCSNIYVADALMGTIRVFDKLGKELSSTFVPEVSYGASPAGLITPCDVTIAAGKLYAASTSNAAVEVFSVACTPSPAPALRAVASDASAPGQRGADKAAANGASENSAFRGEKRQGVDNPFEVIAAMQSGQYDARFDLKRDRKIDEQDLAVAVEQFGMGTAEDFLAAAGAGLRGTYPYPLQPPHMIDIPDLCGRCHSMEGAPGGMLSAVGQQNLCVSCHTGGGRATNTPIGGPGNGNSHPIDMLATAGGVAGPAVDDPIALHLDNGKVRCGTCHNPHEQTYGEPYLRADGEGSALCGKCHQAEAGQWATAGHADPHGEAWVHYDWTQASRVACRKCHSGYGYIDYTNGVADAQQRGNFRVLDCTSCHATHGSTNPDGLRTYGSFVLPGNVTVTDAEGSATCLVCHNGRTTPPAVQTTTTSVSTPHYLSAAVMLEGINGVTFGETITSSPHTELTQCTICHMAASPAAGQPGAGKVGGHTFAMKVTAAGDPDVGFENVGNACNTADCHGATGPRSPQLALTTFNRPAFGDYDGDGTVEGVQDETQGLKDLVLAQIQARGAVQLAGYPYWNIAAVPTADRPLVKNAIWNWEYVDNSGDLGIHNTSYAVGLLQVTYKALTGVAVPNAVLRYSTPVASLPKTVVAITGVNGGSPVAPAGTIAVDFTIQDDSGVAIPKSALARVRFYVSGPVNHQQRVIYQETITTSASLIQNPDGSYTYNRPTPFPTVYLAPLNDTAVDFGEWTGQPLVDGTYVVLIEARRTVSGVNRNGDAKFDFVVANDPLNPPALTPRQLVTRDACNACHNDLQLHGGNRKAADACTACHNIGAEDDTTVTPGLTVNYSDMIHQIHRGADLPQVKATAKGLDPYKYAINGTDDFSQVGFPILPDGIRRCEACHGGAAQGAQIYADENITRAKCGTCHDDIDFGAGTILDPANASVAGGLLLETDLGNAAYRRIPDAISHVFADDSLCWACHGVGKTWDIEKEHQFITNPAKEGVQPALEIVSVTGMTGGGGTYFKAGDRPRIQFKLKNNNADPLQLVTNNKTVVDSLSFLIMGPTTLYQNIIPAVSPWSSGKLSSSVPPGDWINNFAVDGTYTYVIAALPANFPAAIYSIGQTPASQIFPFAGGWGQMYTAAGTPLSAGTYTAIGYGRRLASDLATREPIATGTLDIPFGAAGPIVPYSGTVETASCNACHGTMAFHGNQREGIMACLGCHAAGAQNRVTGESIDMRIMTHKLHNARNLTVQPYQLNTYSGLADFSHLLISSMPGEAAECQVCHTTDAWKSPPVRDTMRTWMVACTSCHDSVETATHVGAATVAGTFVETCASCHGAGTPWSIEKAHKSP